MNQADAEVVALCGTREELVERRRRQFPQARGALRYEEMLDWDLDLVEVLTPHPDHEEIAVAALSAGAHVSVQKPMAMTTAQCDIMIAQSRLSRRRLQLFENFVFYPPLVKARELLMEGAIGEPTHFRMKVVGGDRSTAWSVPAETDAWRQQLGIKGLGGPLVFDHGHHLMAVALRLLGDVRDVFARIETTRTPARSVLDAPATLTWRHLHPRLHGIWDVSLALKTTDYYASHEQFEIQDESVLIQVNRCSDHLLDEPALTLYRDGEVRAWHNLEDDWAESFRRSTLHFLDVLAGRAPEAVLTAEEGRRVIELFHAFDLSSREGRIVVLPEADGRVA
jgi:predicted dehydrogenase